jgi:BCD family chlorophyll transporter-like MFS transporter
MLRKRLQLALIHVAVAMTLVPINSTLNRVMIKELALSATLVSLLAVLPYLFSPIQVAIGAYSDKHPILGYRRTPYILFGLLLNVAGLALAPSVVYILPQNFGLGLLLSILVFGAWGMGYNFASVSYLSLATELSGEKERSKTIAVMFFFMIVAIIFTAIGLSSLLEVYSPEIIQSSFLYVAWIALALGLLGLIKLEPRQLQPLYEVSSAERTGWNAMIKEVFASSQVKRFFIYLALLLAAILGQDVLLEPFGAEAFGLSVQATTRITSIWGACMLLALALSSFLERWIPKKKVALISACIAVLGFALIAASGFMRNISVFYSGVVFLGLGTGASTTSNLSLMLDMTTTRVGLFMGAWGVSNAISRFIGILMSGVIRDVAAHFLDNAVFGYLVVFIIQIIMLVVSVWLLQRIDVSTFKKQVVRLNMHEKAAIMNETA